MVVNADILLLTRFNCSSDGYLEILPTGIAKHFLQITGEPYLDLLFAVIAAYCLTNTVEGLFVLVYPLNIHKISSLFSLMQKYKKSDYLPWKRRFDCFSAGKKGREKGQRT